MGTDYDKRKAAKKAWKKVGKSTAEHSLIDKAAARLRKKTGSRSMCQGMCYNVPSLTTEDKDWNGKIEEEVQEEDRVMDPKTSQLFRVMGAPLMEGSDGEADDVVVPASLAGKRDRNGNLKALPEKTKAISMPQQLLAYELANGNKKEKRDKKKPKKEAEGAVKLSTGVHLLDPGMAARQAEATALARILAKGARAGAEAQVVEAVALAPFPAVIRTFMLSQGFTEPTPVQDACWPTACERKDLQAVAEPGSGKTLAYLLPSVHQLQLLGHSGATTPECPALLILAPTRELALQVAAICRLVRKLTGLRTACIYGGVPKEQQVELLQRRPHIVVATPGRLLDLVDDGALTLQPLASAEPLPTSAEPAAVTAPAGVQVVVLDEADKMLSLGFQPQLQRLHDLLKLGTPLSVPPVQSIAASKAGKRKAGSKAVLTEEVAVIAPEAGVGRRRPQVLLFTATMPAELAVAAATWLASGADKVHVSTSAASISKTITQVVQVCAEHKKPAKLFKHLAAVKDKAATGSMRNMPRVLVFANRIKTVRFLQDALSKEGYRCVMLHGQRSQPERDSAMLDFRSGKAQVMVATDVAARGLDVRMLPFVVNYDIPGDLDTYIHRVGRTGRLAAFGHAYSFFTRNLMRIAGPVVELLQLHGQAVDPNLVKLAEVWASAEAALGAQGAAAAAQKLAKADAQASRRATRAANLEEGEEEEDSEGEDSEAEDEEGEAGGATTADASFEAEDLDEGLQGAKNSAGSRPPKKAAKAQPPARKADEAEEGQAKPPSLQQRLSKAARLSKDEAGVAEPGAHAALLAKEAPSKATYIASKRFTGQRAGYVFKLDTQGLGYHLDCPPKVMSKAQLKQLIGSKGKGPIIPIGPQGKTRRGRNRFDSSSSDDEADTHQSPWKTAASSKQPQQATDSDGDDNGGDDGSLGTDIDDQPTEEVGGSKAAAAAAGGGAASKRKKAVPGRLRKKLAKMHKESQPKVVTTKAAKQAEA